MRRLRLGRDDLERLAPELAPVLAVLCRPEVRVDIDLAVGASRLHSWHGRAAARVATLSTGCHEHLEVSWGGDGEWQAELARAVTVSLPDREPEHPPAPETLELPHEALLGAGNAVAEHRDDLLIEVAHRHHLDPGVLRRVHSTARGRMRTAVSTGRAVGWVTWLLYDDGWRALTPHTDAGVPMVRIHPVSPEHLGVEVARLVMETAA